ncbi:MAG: hypothetical protein ACSHXW_04750 [Yoonia sp.]
MSYNAGWDEVATYRNNYGDSASPMAFDIAILQQCCGANDDYNNGNYTYELADANAAGTAWMSIWDAGGLIQSCIVVPSTQS